MIPPALFILGLLRARVSQWRIVKTSFFLKRKRDLRWHCQTYITSISLWLGVLSHSVRSLPVGKKTPATFFFTFSLAFTLRFFKYIFSQRCASLELNNSYTILEMRLGWIIKPTVFIINSAKNHSWQASDGFLPPSLSFSSSRLPLGSPHS